MRLGIIDCLIVGCLLWRYVRAPMALYRMPAGPFNPNMRLVAADEALDADVAAFLDQSEHALGTAGFADPQRITVSSDAPLSAVETLCENHATGDLANVVAVLNPRATTMSRLVSCVTFRTDFADGTVFHTSNATSAGFWPSQPTHCDVTLPEVRDPLELYRLHRARVAQQATSVAQTMLTRGETPEQRLAYANVQFLDSTDFQIGIGYRKRSPAGVRLTAIGATLMAWRRLFPWKQLGERSRRRAAADVMRLA